MDECKVPGGTTEAGFSNALPGGDAVLYKRAGHNNHTSVGIIIISTKSANGQDMK